MKPILSIFILLLSNALFSQGTSNFVAINNFSFENIHAKSSTIDANGFNFELLDACVNSAYSEIGSGFFRNKLIMVSSKKLGGLAKIDPNTNEAYKDLFCLDISLSLIHI